MKRTIHKQALPQVENVLEIPKGAEILHVDIQPNDEERTPQVWYTFDSDNEDDKELRSFVVLGTGWSVNFNNEIDHIGTIIDREFVWHVFEVKA